MPARCRSRVRASRAPAPRPQVRGKGHAAFRLRGWCRSRAPPPRAPDHESCSRKARDVFRPSAYLACMEFRGEVRVQLLFAPCGFYPVATPALSSRERRAQRRRSPTQLGVSVLAHRSDRQLSDIHRHRLLWTGQSAKCQPGELAARELMFGTKTGVVKASAVSAVIIEVCSSIDVAPLRDAGRGYVAAKPDLSR